MSMISPLANTGGGMDRYGTNRFMVPHTNHQQLAPPPANSYYASGHHQQQQQQQQQHMPLSRPQHPNYMIGCFSPNSSGWAGVPLISTASRRPRKNNLYNSNGIKQRILVPSSAEYDETAMSQLAIHAHGAPLILTRGYRNRNQKGNSLHKLAVSSTVLAGHGRNKNEDKNCLGSTKIPGSATSTGSVDSASVASDESTTNSNATTEASLPRIIKPRKRRKKDRKPQNVCMPDPNIMVLNSQRPDPNQLSPIECGQNVSPNVCNGQQLFLENNVRHNNSSAFSLANDIPLQPSTTLAHQQMDNSVNFSKLQQFGDISTSACYCRLCDPSCRIWAFPLRRSCSDNSAEIEMQKNSKDVGVIGSNRSWTSKTEWRSSQKLDVSDSFLSRNGSFSDSGDSGCEILSGINFVDDIFNNNSNFGSAIKSKDFPTGSPQWASIDDTAKKNVNDFPTAESLLTESINEISKKLMETVDLRSDVFSSDTSSVFSESGVISDDVLFNIESLTKSAASIFCAGGGDIGSVIGGNGDKFLNDSYEFGGPCIGGSNNSSSRSAPQGMFASDSNFVMFHEKDRENEILNCFDMVWSGSKYLSFGRENSAAV